MNPVVAVLRFLAVLALLAGFSGLSPATAWAQDADPIEAVDDGSQEPPAVVVAEEPVDGGDGVTDVSEVTNEEPVTEPAPPADATTEMPPVDTAPPNTEDPSAGDPTSEEQPVEEGSIAPDIEPTVVADPAAPDQLQADTTETEGEPPEVAPLLDQAAEEELDAAHHTGAVVVHKVDAAGADLPGACFAVFLDTGGGALDPGYVNDSCDSSDGTNDGFTTVGGLAPGNYVLLEYFAPDGSTVGGTVAFSIAEVGQVVELTVQNVAGGATLTILKLDELGNPLAGACFQIHADAGGGTQGAVVAASCDFLDGVDDGYTVITGLTPGAYVAVETWSPAGYPVGAQQAFVIAAGQTEAYLEFVNERGGATLVLNKVDQFGVPQLGVCFDVFVDAGGGALGAFVTGGCDAFDGAVDGTTLILGLLPGDYVLNEYNVPHGYVASRYLVTIPAGQSEVVFTARNVPTTAHVQVVKCYFATDGKPRTEIDVLFRLPEEVAAAGAEAGCVPGEGDVFELVLAETDQVVATLVTGANGRAEADVPPGTYVLIEVGEGFAEVGELVAGGVYVFFVQNFVARGDLPAAPTPEPREPGEEGFGTVEVFVFACEEGGEATQILVSEPVVAGVDAAGLAADDGAIVSDTCAPGTASVVFNDEEAIEIETGITFSNIPVGPDTITELCSRQTAEFGVFAGETTKIFIFDFGAPCAGEETPSPAPTETPTVTPGATPVQTPTAGKVTTLPSTGAGSAESLPGGGLAHVLLAAAGLTVLVLGHQRRRRAR